MSRKCSNPDICGGKPNGNLTLKFGNMMNESYVKLIVALVVFIGLALYVCFSPTSINFPQNISIHPIQ